MINASWLLTLGKIMYWHVLVRVIHIHNYYQLALLEREINGIIKLWCKNVYQFNFAMVE